jgi:hypothetical protein
MRLGAGEFRATDTATAEPIDPEPLREMLEPALSHTTLAVLGQTPREKQAGAILGSPEFMRC